MPRPTWRVRVAVSMPFWRSFSRVFSVILRLAVGAAAEPVCLAQTVW